MKTAWKNVCQAKLFFDFHRKHTHSPNMRKRQRQEEHTRGREIQSKHFFFLHLPFFMSSTTRRRRGRRPRIRNIKCLCTRYGRNIKVKCYFQTLNTLCKQYMAAANTKMRLPVVQKAKKKNLKPLIWIISVTHFDQCYKKGIFNFDQSSNCCVQFR